MAKEHPIYWRAAHIPYRTPPSEWSRVLVLDDETFSIRVLREWCNDPSIPGEWAWVPSGGADKVEFAFSNPRVAFAFKMRWA